MEFLKGAYNNMHPHNFQGGRDRAEQAVLSTKTVVSVFCAACSLQAGPGAPDLPNYGLSPPVYPSREISFPLSS
jgi:beta-glucosidase